MRSKDAVLFLGGDVMARRSPIEIMIDNATWLDPNELIKEAKLSPYNAAKKQYGEGLVELETAARAWAEKSKEYEAKYDWILQTSEAAALLEIVNKLRALEAKIVELRAL